MTIAVSDLLLISFFTGIGAGVGNPIGQWIFQRFIKRTLEERIERLDLISRYDIKKQGV